MHGARLVVLALEIPGTGRKRLALVNFGEEGATREVPTASAPLAAVVVAPQR